MEEVTFKQSRREGMMFQINNAYYRQNKSSFLKVNSA